MNNRQSIDQAESLSNFGLVHVTRVKQVRELLIFAIRPSFAKMTFLLLI